MGRGAGSAWARGGTQGRGGIQCYGDDARYQWSITAPVSQSIFGYGVSSPQRGTLLRVATQSTIFEYPHFTLAVTRPARNARAELLMLILLSREDYPKYRPRDCAPGRARQTTTSSCPSAKAWKDWRGESKCNMATPLTHTRRTWTRLTLSCLSLLWKRESPSYLPRSL